MANGVATGSFVSGLFRVFQAGEKLLIEQAELLRLDSRERIAMAAARAGLVALGALFLFTGWLGLLIGWVVAFDDVWTLPARIGVAVAAQLVVGVALLVGARRARPISDDSSSST
jgi:hypothetical protein